MNRIRKIGVVGAGTMGAAIAQHFGMKTLGVTLVDREKCNLDRGLGLIEDGLSQAVERRIIAADEKNHILNRIHGTIDLSELGDCDLVVEAVYEDRNLKNDVFRQLESIVRPECILASNTSSFLISEIADGLHHPERVIGLHYFYHAAKNKLIEIVPGEKTSSDLATDLYRFYYSVDKIPIIVKDSPGFAVNRFFVPWLNEAARLYEEGHGSIPFIDQTAGDVFGTSLGPFALMNATGVSIAFHAARGLAEKFGSFYEPAGSLQNQVVRKIAWDLNDSSIPKSGSNDKNVVRERLVSVVLDIAGKLVDEGVTDAASVDLGARVGLRWPRGPFEMGKRLGRLAKTGTPQWLVSSTMGDCGIIEFNIPDRLNALNPEVMDQLSDCFQSLDADSRIRTVFITGRGKAFVAGADIKFFLDAMEQGEIGRIYDFTKAGHELFRRIERSSKRVVAYLNGLVLGGGLELALACHARLACPKALLAFPETGIGIYPGLGGTQRTPRLIGKGLAKFLIATGRVLNARTALEYGLVDEVLESDVDAEDLPKHAPRESHTRLGGNNAAPELADAFCEFGGEMDEVERNPVLKSYEKNLREKAPIGLRIAMSLVDSGSNLALGEALDLELARLEEIFSTPDARIGLKSILDKSRPRFVGKRGPSAFLPGTHCKKKVPGAFLPFCKGFHGRGNGVGATFGGVCVVEGRRTPFGKLSGALATVSPTDLGIVSSRAAIEASGIAATEIDQTIVACIGQASADAFFLPRHIGLYSGAPLTSPALLVQRICGSGIELISEAAEQIALGKADVVLGCGTETMSRFPLASFGMRQGFALGRPDFVDLLWDALNDTAAVPMGCTADNLAKHYNISRAETDAFALQSQERYATALEKGVPRERTIKMMRSGVLERPGLTPRQYRLNNVGELADDEPPRRTSFEKLTTLRPVFTPDGPTTAGNACAIADGSSSVVLASEEYVRANGLKSLGRVLGVASIGVEPAMMGIGPVQAIRTVLGALKMSLNDIDLFEINEAFSAQCLAVAKELRLDPDKLNVNGGAIAIGHPLAATGVRLTLDCLGTLRREKKRLGVVAACIGGGQGIALVVEAGE